METQNLKYSKYIYLAVALVMTLGVFLYTGTDVHADDVISNNTQVQITLTDIEEENAVQYDSNYLIQLRRVIPGGSGLNCDKNHCWVNWGQTATAIGHNLVNGIAGGIGGIANPGGYRG